jgi:hypothetical protein
MKNIMKYKGYWAEIKYSDEDECFWGEIEGLKNDSISFEGTTVKELKKDFKDAIFSNTKNNINNAIEDMVDYVIPPYIVGDRSDKLSVLGCSAEPLQIANHPDKNSYSQAQHCRIKQDPTK